MTSASSFRDWFVRNQLTQVRGDPGTGKTTLLRDLVTNWDHGPAWFIAPVLPWWPTSFVSTDTTCLCKPTLEDVAESVTEILEAPDAVPSEMLLVVDDLPDIHLADPKSLVGGAAQMWSRILRRLQDAECTVIVAGTTKATLSQNHPTLGPKALDFLASVIMDFDAIAHHNEGVVVEVTARKNKRGPPGKLGRLWIRPHHQPPVRTT